MTSTPPSRLRADAAHNRRALLDAAAATFAEQGMDASIAQIAVRAGVGKGTVFRHFATKSHLVAAILCDRLDEFTAAGTALLDAADPEAALLEFMTTGVQMQARDRCFCEAGAGIAHSDPEVRAASGRLFKTAEALTDRARRQGSVRADITGEDILLLPRAAYEAAAPMGDVAPDLWRRYLSVIFDGLRPEAARPLPHPAPTSDQFAAMDESATNGGPKAQRRRPGGPDRLEQAAKEADSSS
ncbi:TetR/AcrR family transcriptional regulator [Streptomyces sioyaensis]|uniref:TetR/AcrR family transcriptional regulator n=1 Tax=Streptomyces sioyaensis TaxID=67364 RepID=UPI0037249284